VADQRIENCEDVAAVINHALEDVLHAGLAFRLAMPAKENVRGNFDVPAKLFSGMSAEEEAVEERGFALGEVELPLEVITENGRCPHSETAVYRKLQRRQGEHRYQNRALRRQQSEVNREPRVTAELA
jgi:hypothetical protein